MYDLHKKDMLDMHRYNNEVFLLAMEHVASSLGSTDDTCTGHAILPLSNTQKPRALHTSYLVYCINSNVLETTDVGNLYKIAFSLWADAYASRYKSFLKFNARKLIYIFQGDFGAKRK